MGAGVTALRRLGSSGVGNKKHVAFTEARASEFTDRPLLTGDDSSAVEESGRCSCDTSTPQSSLREALREESVGCSINQSINQALREESVAAHHLGEGSEEMAAMGVTLDIEHDASKPRPPDA